MNGEKFDKDSLEALVGQEIARSKDYDDNELADTRARNLEYLRGEMNDVPPRPGGSKITTRTVNDVVSWALPGIIRVFTASDIMGMYEPEDDSKEIKAARSAVKALREQQQPIPPELAEKAAESTDEEFAEQATDYANFVFFRDNGGYKILYNATHDALAVSGDGVVKTWWDATPDTKVTYHTRLTVDQIAELKQMEGVEVLTQDKNPELDQVMLPNPETGVPEPGQVETYNIKVSREMNRGKIKIRTVAPENFMLDQDATSMEDARFVAEYDPTATRSDLIEMGFDRETVDDLTPGRDTEYGGVNDARQGIGWQSGSSSQYGATERVGLYECYLKVDVDDDGIAETVKVFYAGDAGAGKILDWEVCDDDSPFSLIPCYPRPHRADSESMADRTQDLQKVSTVLLRQLLDNQYASNLPMLEAEEGSVLNPDILINPKFGATIWKKRGSAPIQPHAVPFVADKIYPALGYIDTLTEKRTGISRQTMALDPEALQNQTATANQNAKDASYSQIELIARNQAELGWRDVFKKILRLSVRHQDRPRTIRLRNKFVEVNPASWNADMDCVINVGLGTGSRDRDMAMLSAIIREQKEAIAGLMANGAKEDAIEMLPKLYHSLIKFGESAGVKNADEFFIEFDDARVDKLKQQAANAKPPPDPSIQIEQMRQQFAEKMKPIDMQMEMKKEELKAQGNASKEQSQLQADMQTKEADRQNALILETQRQQFEAELKSAELAFKRQKHDDDMFIKLQELGIKMDDAEKPEPAKGKGA